MSAGNPERPAGNPERDLPSGWDLLLDRLEHRLRLLEAAAMPNGQSVDVGPPVSDADRPFGTPTPEQRIRLLALTAQHDRVIERLERRRRTLRQAQQYRMSV